MRIIKMMSRDLIPITEEEFESLREIKSGLVFIPSLDELLNVSLIERVMNEESYKQSSNNGILHDGTLVIKKFGEWVSLKNPDIKLDKNYYPEIVKDEVETYLPPEFEAVKKLEDAKKLS